jgi:peptidoglycan/xylan/chitin deacetylase (PgdA/CDA1 family)
MSRLYIVYRIDCESTQAAVDDAALGRRATAGYADVLESHGLRGTFCCIPSEIRANSDLYLDLNQRGHELALHVHPADQGYEEFLGIYGPDDQAKIVQEGTDLFAEVTGERPHGICLGYGSRNDFTAMVLHEIGFRHGMTMIPGRILPECASVAAGAPLDAHYAHPYNRVLKGGLDFVEIPDTLDPESMMWGGKHPQDLRVELVDAKNHFYTIQKALLRQLAAEVKLPLIHCGTHNVFEYGEAGDFRRETLVGIIEHTKRLAEESGLSIAPATMQEYASEFRKNYPVHDGDILTLDRSGHGS